MSNDRYIQNAQHVVVLDGLDQRGVYRSELDGVVEQTLRRQIISCYLIESTLSRLAELWHGVSNLSKHDLLAYYDVNFNEQLVSNILFLERCLDNPHAPITRILDTLKRFTNRLHTYSHEDIGKSIVAALVCGMLLVQIQLKMDESVFKPESRNVSRTFLENCLRKANLALPGINAPGTVCSRQAVEKYTVPLVL